MTNLPNRQLTVDADLNFNNFKATGVKALHIKGATNGLEGVFSIDAAGLVSYNYNATGVRPLIAANGTISAPGTIVASGIGISGNQNVTHIALSTGLSGAFAAGTLTITATGGGGGIAGIDILEEDTPLTTQATALNFLGIGINASGGGATKIVRVDGLITADGGGDIDAVHTGRLTFTGAGVVVSGTGFSKTITIAGAGGGGGVSIDSLGDAGSSFSTYQEADGNTLSSGVGTFRRISGSGGITSALIAEGGGGAIARINLSIEAGDITMSKLSQAGAIQGQALRWSGSAWAAQGAVSIYDGGSTLAADLAIGSIVYKTNAAPDYLVVKIGADAWASFAFVADNLTNAFIDG